MKQLFHKVGSLLMIFVVLFSTMSFTIDMHYCGNTLVDSAILNQAKSCGMEILKTPSKDCSITKKDCCTNKQVIVDGQDELKTSFDTLSLDQQIFFTSFIYSYINLYEGLKENETSYNDYAPPLVVRSIYKLVETYLI